MYSVWFSMWEKWWCVCGMLRLVWTFVIRMSLNFHKISCYSIFYLSQNIYSFSLFRFLFFSLSLSHLIAVIALIPPSASPSLSTHLSTQTHRIRRLRPVRHARTGRDHAAAAIVARRTELGDAENSAGTAGRKDRERGVEWEEERVCGGRGGDRE